MSWFRTSLLLALTLGASASNSRAQINLVTGQDPDQQEQLGFVTSYSAKPSYSDYPPSLVWSWRQTDCGADPENQNLVGPIQTTTSAWMPSSGTIEFTIPGQFEIRCVVTYGSVSRPPPNPLPPGYKNPPDPDMFIYPVTIKPPEVASIQGDNVPGPYYQVNNPPTGTSQPREAASLGGIPGCWIYFVLKSNGKRIGTGFGCQPQEQLTQWAPLISAPPMTYLDPPYNDEWRPNNPSATKQVNIDPSTQFVYDTVPGQGVRDYAICDFKSASRLVYPDNSTITGKLLTCIQENRLLWTDFNQGKHYKYLGKNNWTITGDPDGVNWRTTYQ